MKRAISVVADSITDAPERRALSIPRRAYECDICNCKRIMHIHYQKDKAEQIRRQSAEVMLVKLQIELISSPTENQVLTANLEKDPVDPLVI